MIPALDLVSRRAHDMVSSMVSAKDFDTLKLSCHIILPCVSRILAFIAKNIDAKILFACLFG